MAIARVQLPDGRIARLEVPEGSTGQQVEAFVMENMKNMGDKSDSLPNNYPPPPKAAEPGFLDKVKGVGEAALAVGTGVVGGIPGMIGGALGGIAGSIASGHPARGENPEIENVAKESAQRLTYAPRTEAGKDYLQRFGQAMEASKLAGLNPALATELSVVSQPATMAVASSARNAAAGAKRAGGQIASGAAELVKREERPAMAGMGSAMTVDETLRRERAKGLPVPINLSKGEATRDFAQQRFEKETMKNSASGEPLRQHAADNVQKVIQNFEAWIDETGAQAPDLISVGMAVDRPLVRKMESAKAEIRNAYDKAERSGDMAEKIDPAPLLRYLEENRSSSKLAPVLAAAENELMRLKGASKNADGVLFPEPLSLNDAEKVRKMVVRLSKADETNGHYGSEINGVIDAMTEGKGGDLYKKARTMYRDYASEFKNQGAVRKLVSTKPGSTDRSVALEDVFNHSVLSGSNQDTMNIIRSLEGAGPEGLQGIKELKGATMNYLLGKTTENAARDIRNNPIPSFSKIDKAVRALDADGKLDLLFGKKGAAQIRDLKELIADIHTAPPGAVNTSTTTATLMEALGALATGRIPTATVKAISGIKQAVGDRATLKKVREALVDPDEEAVIGAGSNTVH